MWTPNEGESMGKSMEHEMDNASLRFLASGFVVGGGWLRLQFRVWRI